MLIDKAKEIAKKINDIFPEINVFLEYYNNDKNQACILVDSEETFYSDKYVEFIANIEDEIEEYDINFSCLSLMRKLKKSAINLTEENKYKYTFNIEDYLLIEKIKEVYINKFFYAKTAQKAEESFFKFNIGDSKSWEIQTQQIYKNKIMINTIAA